MKIQSVTINKYKAFTKEEKIPIGGKNVFVYGENGSGKSSFYYALKDFFQSSVEVVNMADLRNFNLTDGGTDCSIQIEFDGAIIKTLSETSKDTNTAVIIDANRLKSFLTYKHLLGVHNVKISQKLDVFDLIITGVLKHFSSQITNHVELQQLWYDVDKESKRDTGAGKPFYFKYQKKASVEDKAIKFNNAINALFLENSPDYVGRNINYILKQFYPELQLKFIRQTISVNSNGEFIKPKLLIAVFWNGRNIANNFPHFSLNESKLSAIAISIFLGVILKQSSFSKDIKPLFLDDILIGLDNENRLKLANILQLNEFREFQIFLTTYDRHWYEVAKMNLPDWKFIEFYKSPNGPQIKHNDKSNLELARGYFESFDFPAAANYLRKECERLLRVKLLETYTVGEGIKGLIKPINLETLINRLKEFYEDLGIVPPNYLIDSLLNYKSILFNPMSHSDIESPIYRNDLELAFQTIEDLEAIVLPQRSILIEKGTVFNLSLPAIDYVAQLEIARDVYIVEHNGAKTETPISFFFKTWTRAGVLHAAPTGVSPIAVTNVERLEKIKESPFTLDKATDGLNVIFRDRTVTEITPQDLKVAMTLAGGDILNDIIEKAKE